jgi:HD-GYP domain-containing protein (c-di-GMP phosphodiesterase class II)
MMRICDSFDAITEDRPYHMGVSWRQALGIMNNDRRFYDPELLDEFGSMMRTLREDTPR